MIVVLAAATACSEPDAAIYQRVLATGECSELAAVDLRDRCYVEHIDCERVFGEQMRFECAFRRAERSGNVAECADAGSFADDCRMHLWSASFTRWAPQPTLVGRDELLVQREIEKGGFAEGDLRPWSAWFRYSLGEQPMLDRGACQSVLLPVAREACFATGLSLYGDRLNAARDRGLYPCDGGELPAFLRYVADVEIDQLRASRHDLCP